MNESNFPLPQPGGTTCSNCGAAQDASAPYCTNCGAPMSANAPSSMSSSSKLIVSFALGFGALLFGAVGGCFVFLGGFDSSSINLLELLLVGAPLLAALACIWGIFKIQRK